MVMVVVVVVEVVVVQKIACLFFFFFLVVLLLSFIISYRLYIGLLFVSVLSGISVTLPFNCCPFTI